MKNRRDYGVSLVEMLVTLAIIIILTGAAIASYAWVLPWVKDKLGIVR